MYLRERERVTKNFSGDEMSLSKQPTLCVGDAVRERKNKNKREDERATSMLCIIMNINY